MQGRLAHAGVRSWHPTHASPNQPAVGYETAANPRALSDSAHAMAHAMQGMSQNAISVVAKQHSLLFAMPRIRPLLGRPLLRASIVCHEAEKG